MIITIQSLCTVLAEVLSNVTEVRFDSCFQDRSISLIISEVWAFVSF